mmetsp:Transcript_83419/g.232659  ORF Transcript_83419/g.232659 Transcript_83419/m.232659 type:complete len:240 (+) Transcript_83419:773-1492(+)
MRSTTIAISICRFSRSMQSDVGSSTKALAFSAPNTSPRITNATWKVHGSWRPQIISFTLCALIVTKKTCVQKLMKSGLWGSAFSIMLYGITEATLSTTERTAANIHGLAGSSSLKTEASQVPTRLMKLFRFSLVGAPVTGSKSAMEAWVIEPSHSGSITALAVRRFRVRAVFKSSGRSVPALGSKSAAPVVIRRGGSGTSASGFTWNEDARFAMARHTSFGSVVPRSRANLYAAGQTAT